MNLAIVVILLKLVSMLIFCSGESVNFILEIWINMVNFFNIGYLVIVFSLGILVYLVILVNLVDLVSLVILVIMVNLVCVQNLAILVNMVIQMNLMILLNIAKLVFFL